MSAWLVLDSANNIMGIFTDRRAAALATICRCGWYVHGPFPLNEVIKPQITYSEEIMGDGTGETCEACSEQ